MENLLILLTSNWINFNNKDFAKVAEVFFLAFLCETLPFFAVKPPELVLSKT